MYTKRYSHFNLVDYSLFDISVGVDETFMSAIKYSQSNPTYTGIYKTIIIVVRAILNIHTVIARACVDVLMISAGILLTERLRQISMRINDLIENQVGKI